LEPEEVQLKKTGDQTKKQRKQNVEPFRQGKQGIGEEYGQDRSEYQKQEDGDKSEVFQQTAHE